MGGFVRGRVAGCTRTGGHRGPADTESGGTVAQVQTVRGPVDTADLGQVLMHEHVFVLTADVQQNYPEEWGDEDARVADAVSRLTELASRGVRTIVDPTVVGLGRYIPRIQRIAEQVDLNIVVATGCYTYEDVPFFLPPPRSGPRRGARHVGARPDGGHVRAR